MGLQWFHPGWIPLFTQMSPLKGVFGCLTWWWSEFLPVPQWIQFNKHRVWWPKLRAEWGLFGHTSRRNTEYTSSLLGRRYSPAGIFKRSKGQGDLPMPSLPSQSPLSSEKIPQYLLAESFRSLFWSHSTGDGNEVSNGRNHSSCCFGDLQHMVHEETIHPSFKSSLHPEAFSKSLPTGNFYEWLELVKTLRRFGEGIKDPTNPLQWCKQTRCHYKG